MNKCFSQVSQFSQFPQFGEIKLPELKALHEGFKAFCADVGIDYESALTCQRKSVIAQDFIDLQDQQLIDLKLDNECIEKAKNKFLELWD